MSNSEFDQYLALLGGLLRLNAAQREEIASELRDHLEERLAELLDQGVARHRAIAIALEEFGDAAGLASEFVQIFQRERRRRIMRTTFGTAAAISAIVLLVSGLWPEGRSGPSPRQVVAQEEAKGVPARQPQPSPMWGDANSLVEEKLEERIDVEFLETPIKDVFDQLSFDKDLPIYVKKKQIDEAGVDLSSPITMWLKNIPIRLFLELVLEDLELTYFVRDGVVLITSLEDYESLAVVRVYNCRDLLEGNVDLERVLRQRRAAAPEPAPTTNTKDSTSPGKQDKTPNSKPTASPEDDPFSDPFGARIDSHSLSNHVLAQFGRSAGSGVDFPETDAIPEDRLMDIIQIAVMPDSWDDVGGPGTIGEFDGMIVIRHTPRAHRQVEQVLQMLRDAATQQDWEESDED